MPTRPQPKRAVDEEASFLPSTISGRVTKVLGSVFGAELDVPCSFGDGTNVKRDKEFCVGLLENPVNHAWWQSVRGFGHRERLSISGSMFLMRKVLPSSPDPLQAEKHRNLMSAPAPESPADFLQHVDRQIDALFDVGWDRRYNSYVYSHSPTSSACLEYSRAKGGTRRYVSERGRDWYYDQCLSDCTRPTDYKVKYSIVSTGGKQRGVTVASGYASVLGPLHRTLYDHLSQSDWLLRGEARGKKFSSFHRKKGEIFVSGDYESATDNLSLSMAYRILSRILSRCGHIPFSLREYALRSLVAEIHYPGGHVVLQQRGQLMGNFLSFPLLCLQNYLAFTYLIPRPVPVRINGDDIVFRCRPDEYHRWRKGVGAAGLVLSVGKTLVNRTTFSLNSAFFEAQSRRVREIPIIRSSMLCLQEGLPSGDTFTKFCRNWKGEARRLVGGLWLKAHNLQIRASGRSVWALGIPADNSQLHTAGLAVREAFYRGYRNHLSLPEDQVPRVPLDRGIPRHDNWVFSSRPIRATDREKSEWNQRRREDCADMAWQPCMRPNVLWQDWWMILKATGWESNWCAWRRTAKHVHRMGFRKNLVLRPPADGLSRRGQWVPKDELPYRLCSLPGLGWSC